jgi:hypothetical protein
MTRFLIFLVLCTVSFSCTKNTAPAKGFDPSHAITITTGVLHYDNFPDGWGLYYVTDSNVNMIFKNEQGNDSTLYNKYKTYLNLPTRLNYLTNGETGCLYGFGRVCGIDIVEVVSLVKE